MFLDIFIGYYVKLKFGAIRVVVRGAAIFGVIFSKNKTPDYESDVLLIGYLLCLCFFMLCILCICDTGK